MAHDIIQDAMAKITNAFGHAEVVLALAATVGWNARWEGESRQRQLAKVVELLTQAGEILGRIEADESTIPSEHPLSKRPA